MDIKLKRNDIEALLRGEVVMTVGTFFWSHKGVAKAHSENIYLMIDEIERE